MSWCCIPELGSRPGACCSGPQSNDFFATSIYTSRKWTPIRFTITSACLKSGAGPSAANGSKSTEGDAAQIGDLQLRLLYGMSSAIMNCFRAEGIPMVDFDVVPQRTALVNVDMQ